MIYKKVIAIGFFIILSIFPTYTEASLFKLYSEDIYLNNNKINFNFYLPQQWEAKKTSSTSIKLNKVSNYLLFEVFDSSNQLNNWNCYNNVNLKKIDSKLLIKENKNFSEVIIENEKFQSVKFKYKPSDSENIKSFTNNSASILETLHIKGNTYNSCLNTFNSLTTSRFENKDFRITFRATNDSDQEEVINILKQMNLNYLAVPDPNNQINPLNEIKNQVLEAPRRNVLIILGIFISLFLFSLFLLVATRRQQD
ncbi:MAG: hypothetical protein ACRCXZ_01665 [Patescibacteria group bacterium]